jgi:hypothetical protein
MLVFLVVAMTPMGLVLDAEPPPHITSGRMRVPVGPDAVAATLTDYPAWPRTFSDVAWVRVEGADPARARVRFRSKSLQTELTLQFNNSERHVRFTIVDAPGGLIGWGSTTLTPEGKSGTLAVGQLYIHLPASDGLPLSGEFVNRMRERKFKRDAEDLLRHFSTDTR